MGFRKQQRAIQNKVSVNGFWNLKQSELCQVNDRCGKYCFGSKMRCADNWDTVSFWHSLSGPGKKFQGRRTQNDHTTGEQPLPKCFEMGPISFRLEDLNSFKKSFLQVYVNKSLYIIVIVYEKRQVQNSFWFGEITMTFSVYSYW